MIAANYYSIRYSKQVWNEVNELEISKRLEQNQSNKIAYLTQQINSNIKELLFEIENAEEPKEIIHARKVIDDNLPKLFNALSILEHAASIGLQLVGDDEIGLEESDERILIDSLSIMVSRFESSIQKTLELLDDKKYMLAEAMFEDNAENISLNIQNLLLALEKDDEMEVNSTIKQMGVLVKREISIEIILTIFSIILAFSIGLYISKSISSGINKLTDGTGEISKGNLDARVNIKSGDELELLGNSFNSMAEELNMKIMAIDNLNKNLAEANQTKDKFFSIIAHDLKSPFNAMLGFSDLLNEKFEKFDTEKQKKFIGLINTNIQNTYKLLENLLLWSSAQRGTIDFNPEKMNLFLISNETIELLRHSAENKSITLINKIDEDICIDADKNMFSIIIRNLISNAIKYTPKDGRITIKSEVPTHYKQQQFVKISVTDTGVGIQKEIQSKLFDIGENTSTKGTENENGTGLGLILCKEFVEKHNGKIWVESEVGKGSEFTFLIPISKDMLEKYNMQY